MRVLPLSDFDDAMRQAGVEVRAGRAIIYPTDTVYALGVSAISPPSVAGAFAAKGRETAKPLSICVADIDQARAYVEIDARAEALAAAFLPGALTLVCCSKGVLPAALQAGFPGVGVRVPGHPFGPSLCRLLGYPITTTSANISGMPAATDRVSAETAFANAAERPTLLIDGGRSPIAQPSTVVDLCTAGVKLLREGAIPFAEIENVLGRQ